MLSSNPSKRPEVKDILSEHFPKEIKQPNPRPQPVAKINLLEYIEK
jgi:hypothetical protein